jgi:peptidoglycan hydrolase-like protein with peptidoglycan-binding domain
MFKNLCIIILGLTVFPLIAGAAYNDLTLDSNAIVSVGGRSLTVSGSGVTIQSIINDGSALTVSMASGSTLSLQSIDRVVLDVSGISANYLRRDCDSTNSTLTITTNEAQTAVITPSSVTCTVATASSVSVGGSGGGGGGGYAPTVYALSSPMVTPTVSPRAIPVQNLSVSFSTDLSRGMTNGSVRNLQIILAEDPAIYPEGQVTGYFGPATERAVKKFQAKYGITQLGRVGPATRAKLNSLATGNSGPTNALAPAASVASSPTPVNTPTKAGSGFFTGNLSKGDSNSDILRLQQLLNTDPDTKIASIGVGSPGNETGMFGSLTEKAVGKFQLKYKLAEPGDPGFGSVGPATRDMLQEVFP